MNFSVYGTWSFVDLGRLNGSKIRQQGGKKGDYVITKSGIEKIVEVGKENILLVDDSDLDYKASKIIDVREKDDGNIPYEDGLYYYITELFAVTATVPEELFKGKKLGQTYYLTKAGLFMANIVDEKFIILSPAQEIDYMRDFIDIRGYCDFDVHTRDAVLHPDDAIIEEYGDITLARWKLDRYSDKD